MTIQSVEDLELLAIGAVIKTSVCENAVNVNDRE
jgi:hypothetical protein